MSFAEIIKLRENGCLNEAYASMCRLYATDKGKQATCMMFQLASEMLERQIDEGLYSEGVRILDALLRLLDREEAFVADGKERLLPLVFKFYDATEAFPRQKYATFLNQFISIDTSIPDHLALGGWGEQIAMLYLEYKGLTAWNHDWKSGHRDIDIIGRDGDAAVFIEVKTRKTHVLQEPEKAVNYAKLQHIRKSMNHYIKFYHIMANVRFDIVTVVGSVRSFPNIKHIKDVPVLNLR